ncbi:DUF2378 family protein [Hyalangium versicolor]|uniref:DUF2378 family protein n=1 Tax=Hyalangium versicolor TaxID=2861190 RepID=UPI001CCA5D87|nr:DUF2378 family protein [Hyalangium versicolor]
MNQRPPQQTSSKQARALKHSAVEGLLRGFGVGPGSAEMLEAVELVGGVGGLPVEVPLDRYIALIEWLARRHYMSLPLSEGVRCVGMRMLQGYRQTLLGQIQLKALNLMGPDRLMRKVPDFIGRNSNFGERTVEQLGPRHWRLVFRGIPIAPEFYQGLGEAAFEIMGIKKVNMTFVRKNPEDTDFDIRWE